MENLNLYLRINYELLARLTRLREEIGQDGVIAAIARQKQNVKYSTKEVRA